MKRLIIALSFVVIFYQLTACQTVYNVDRVSSEDIAQEGTIVFVRPTDYTVFGTKSLKDYIEVTYESVSRNNADLLQVAIGFRNRGGQHFYDTRGPNFQLSVKTAFYDKRFGPDGRQISAPVYETNWQTITLLRGATEHYKVICPVKSATFYQVTVSELLK